METNATEDRFSLVVFSGTTDKMIAVATLTTGAAAIGMEVDLFLTFWGLEAFKKGASERQLPITSEYADMGPMMGQLMQAKQVPHWLKTIKDAREIGDVHIYACSATMELFGHKLGDLEEVVDEVTGVATFMDRAKDGKITLFI